MGVNIISDMEVQQMGVNQRGKNNRGRGYLGYSLLSFKSGDIDEIVMGIRVEVFQCGEMISGQ